nr:MoaD/ThiS family protein [Simkaniaceae bacterium]
MNVKYEGKIIEISEGISGRELADQFNLREPHQALALLVNGKAVDLTTPLHHGDEVAFLHFDDKLGKEIFWHTSSHILAQAVLRLYPNAKPTIGPAIENGFYYDFANLELSEDDFKTIEKEVQKIIKENHRPLRKLFKNREEALEAFKVNPYKSELIQGFEEGEFTAYQQGEFFDLCRGPHLPSLGKVKAFKIMKTSGAYWRGDSNREMLTRLYGISFPSKEELQASITQLEESKKRDHRLIGQKLDLYSFHEESPGIPFF